MTDDALNKLAEPAARKAAALPRWLVAVLAALLAVFVLCAAAATWVLVSQHSHISAQDAQLSALDARADRSDAAAQQLVQQVQGLGAVPVVQPPAASVEPASVDPAAILAAARSAVLDYCAQPNQPCRGKDGEAPNVDAIVVQVVAKIPLPKDGRDAPAPTDAELLGIVTSYCSQADSPCTGPAGAKGDKGDKGDTGEPGAAGPACPDGYELRDAVITAPDGSTYQGKACVDPSSSQPPSEPSTTTTPPTETP